MVFSKILANKHVTTLAMNFIITQASTQVLEEVLNLFEKIWQNDSENAWHDVGDPARFILTLDISLQSCTHCWISLAKHSTSPHLIDTVS